MIEKGLWITWHIAQRSRSLSKDLGVPIFEKVIENNPVGRHFLSSLWTIYVLLKERPTNIYLQYSFLLLLVLVGYKRLAPYPVHIICDCHTKALRRRLGGYFGKIFWWFKERSFHYTDICIVSNIEMEPDIKILTNRYCMLPDKIPEILPSQATKPEDAYCVFVGSYAVDEPLDEVIAAAKRLDGLVKIYCTGKIPENLSSLKSQPHKNTHFTDYLSTEEYYNLLANADCVLALTSEDGCLQCAGYEALSTEVPLVLSDTSALKAYFEGAAIYVKHNAQDIESGVRHAINARSKLISSIRSIKELRNQEYQTALNELNKLIVKLNKPVART